ncbi:MAG TPA: LuxR C-terminal-related transcriptional regulator [Gaiellaceae bacterium]|nr:LuxR C-terminal-related transcriptional regulator [Gaiellaceae bacterium]
MGALVEQGRAAAAEMAWEHARAALTAADEEDPLAAADVELLAMSLYMLGRVGEFLVALERAYDAYLEADEPLRATRCAFYLGINLAIGGEVGRASGWFARAQRLVEGRDCVERGYLLMPIALRDEAAGDYAAVCETTAQAIELGERFRDRDLFSLALHTQGLALIRLGRVPEGLARFDEAMLGASAGELSPVVTGVVYCGVIAGCEEAFELRRAQEWTDALASWIERQPELVAFSGRCMAHRAELMLLHGSWRAAFDEARRARERAERAANRAAAGQAVYQQGEVHRLLGDLEAAESAYVEANRLGREPQPGLALLRLAQGDTGAAAALLRRALAETAEPARRVRLLPAYVEVMLAAGDDEAAGTACDELEQLAPSFASVMLRAVVDRARAHVEFAQGDARAALISARRALQAWQELDAPYEAARARAVVALACRALGDTETADLELGAARAAFERLGATLELALLQPERPGATHGLTPRELEVLRLVAAGKSNRDIAAALVVSEHTVARHVQNIFAKLRVSSRTAATAFAFEHELV